MLVRDLLVVVIEVHSVFPFQLAQLVVGVGFLALRRAFCVFVEERQCVIVPVCLFSAVDFVVQVCEQATSFPHVAHKDTADHTLSHRWLAVTSSVVHPVVLFDHRGDRAGVDIASSSGLQGSSEFGVERQVEPLRECRCYQGVGGTDQTTYVPEEDGDMFPFQTVGVVRSHTRVVVFECVYPAPEHVEIAVVNTFHLLKHLDGGSLVELGPHLGRQRSVHEVIASCFGLRQPLLPGGLLDAVSWPIGIFGCGLYNIQFTVNA
mmetsp:Transcript_16542/g.23229  ORF Transcript_16542/g.23229 Transcript_16542/m.23229 type:complete len:262 (+) Transcript_16542:285-1070(+)